MRWRRCPLSTKTFAVFRKELVDTLRDGRSVFAIFIFPSGHDNSLFPAVKVPPKITVLAFWLILMKPPGPTMRLPKRLTFTLPCSSISANDRKARSSPPPS